MKLSHSGTMSFRFELLHHDSPSEVLYLCFPSALSRHTYPVQLSRYVFHAEQRRTSVVGCFSWRIVALINGRPAFIMSINLMRCYWFACEQNIKTVRVLFTACRKYWLVNRCQRGPWAVFLPGGDLHYRTASIPAK